MLAHWADRTLHHAGTYPGETEDAPMIESRFLADLATVVAGGFVGALTAHALRLPTVAGYLAAGVLLGPGATGLVRDSEIIRALADLGVGLLMFAIGVELSLEAIARTKPAALIAAPFQIFATTALGYGLGRAMGWPDAASLVLGFALALSSTMVVVKLLSERRELHTRHGQAMVAVLLVQDLAAVFMVAALPLLSGLSTGGMDELLTVMARAALFVALVFGVARWVAPALMHLVAGRYSREVFLGLSAMLCFGGAVAASLLGFSLALGAFVAGLVISESHYRHQVLSDVTPLRDLFGMVFFVSLGLLCDLRTLSQHLAWSAFILSAIFVGKPVIAILGLLLARCHARNAMVAGLGLAQIGEFSFLVVTLAWRSGLVGDVVHGLLVPIAGASLLASPALLRLGDFLYERMRKTAAGERALDRHERGRGLGVSAVQGHVILCGYGRVGRFVGDLLLSQEQPLAVIEYHRATVAELGRRGVPAIYGDASRRAILSAAGAERARLAVIALPDGASAATTVGELRRLNPSLKIIARAHQVEELHALYRAGADEVIYAEYEASLELLRHALLLLERAPPEVAALVAELRQGRYERLPCQEDGNP